jgi:hypothetical protein
MGYLESMVRPEQPRGMMKLEHPEFIPEKIRRNRVKRKETGHKIQIRSKNLKKFVAVSVIENVVMHNNNKKISPYFLSFYLNYYFNRI